MRTRKSNKSKRFSYTEAYELGSEDSEQELEDLEDGDVDVDFEVPDAGEEGQDDSPDDEADDDALNDGRREVEELSGGDKPGDVPRPVHEVDDPMDTDGEEEEGEDDDHGTLAKSQQRPKGRGRLLKKKLVKRSIVHIVPPYPSDLQQTRVYDGPLKRWKRAHQLLTVLYGPNEGHIRVIAAMLRKWFESQTLPNKHTDKGGVMHSPWLPEDYEEKERLWSKSWYGKYRAASRDLQRSRKIRPEHIDMFKPPSHAMACFMGPFSNQRPVQTSYGSGIPVSRTGEPWKAIDSNSPPSTPPKGWLLDTGGIPLGIGWAPLTGHREQFLAVCTVPYADQEPKDHNAPEDDSEEKKRGGIQIWSIPCHKNDGIPARLIHSFQFDFGRSKRMQWCPVAPPDNHTIGMLAVLCGDGQVRVFDVPNTTSGQENYEWVTSPVATLGFTDEYMVQATCLTWVNTNRICLGHTDGSISLWSVYPQRMLMRRSVHNSHILDVASGFPSHPYHIATSPVSGCPTLTDLNLPSAETTSIPLIGNVNFQPNLLDWNDHLQGYFNIYPTTTPHNTVIGWTHVRFFVQSRAMMTTLSQPMCIASGRTHPFTLVGCADGSVWAFNPLRVLMRDKVDEIHKLKIMGHEFRPTGKIPPATVDAVGGGSRGGGGGGGKSGELRGAVRILQGFKPEINSNPRAEVVRDVNKKRPAKQKKSKGSGGGGGGGGGSSNSRRRGKAEAADEMDLDTDEDGLTKIEGQALAKLLEQTKAVIHETKTRITVAAWNPNVEYGWWAAIAMGSGLVKVMDLGIGE